MLLPEKTMLTIKSGETFSTAIYERQYTLTVLAASDKKAVISVNACSRVPSGYVDADSHARLIESDEYDIPNGSAKEWLARLALAHDSAIRERCGCGYANRAANSILNQLEALSGATAAAIALS